MQLTPQTNIIIKIVTRRIWDVHFLLLLVRAPPVQTPEPLLLFPFESTLLTFAAGDGKTVGGSYPISAYKNGSV